MSISKEEYLKIQKINIRNGYGLTAGALKALKEKHKKARTIGDTHTMELVEARLTDLNFHAECGWMMQGEYDKVNEVIKEMR